MHLIIRVNNKMFMKVDSLYQIKAECNGCGACASYCSQKAITMVLDKEGFYYPSINEDKCIDCRICERMCPHKKRIDQKQQYELAYGLKYNNSSILKNSTSGGAFSALCRVFYELYPNGVVYGCVLKENGDHYFTAKHIRAKSIEECEQFRGSKYIQSEFWPVFDELENDLKNFHHVMCVGTPCQIAAIHQRFSNKYNDYILLVDILCHSAPSPLMFNEHIKSLERVSGRIVYRYSFRPKTKGWRHFEEAYDQSGTIILKNKRQTQRHKELFYAELISRPACSQCKYAGVDSISDLTLGDFWGIENVLPSFYNKMGVSLVIVHTQKAKRVFSYFNSFCDVLEVDLVQAMRNNHSKPRPINPKRNMFWEDYYTKGFDYASTHYLESDFIWWIKRFVRVFISDQTKKRIKSFFHVR